MTSAATGRSQPRAGERRLERVEDEEADRGLRLRAAPVERHGRDDVGGELVLHQQVADLRPVAVGQDDLDAVRDEAGDRLHRRGDRPLLRLDRRRAVGAGHGVAAEGDERAHLPPSSGESGSVGARGRPAARASPAEGPPAAAGTSRQGQAEAQASPSAR